MSRSAKLGGKSWSPELERGIFRFPLYCARHLAGANVRYGGWLGLRFRLALGHGLFVVRGGFTLGDRYCAGGTRGQAVAHAVAVVVLDESRLAVHHRDGSLMARLGAKAAAVALLCIYLDYLSLHGRSPFMP